MPIIHFTPPLTFILRAVAMALLQGLWFVDAIIPQGEYFFSALISAALLLCSAQAAPCGFGVAKHWQDGVCAESLTSIRLCFNAHIEGETP